MNRGETPIHYLRNARKVMYKRNTKEMGKYYKIYSTANNTKLEDIYSKYSHEKEMAYLRCQEIKQKLNGYGLKLLTHNTFMFTAGFLAELNGKDIFVVITPNNIEYMEVN